MAVSQEYYVEQVSQSIANNSSVIRIMWLSTQSGGSYNNNANTAWVNVRANGTLVRTFSPTYKLTANTTVTVIDTTLTVPHDAEGKCEVSVNFYMETGISAGTIDETRTLTLSTIPRASTLTAPNGTLGQAMTLQINRKASSFKHRITFNCGEFSGYVAGSGSSYTTATSISWTPQIAYSRVNTEGTTVQIQLTLQTYSADGTHVGTDTKTITCAIPESVKPSCSLEVTDASGYSDIYGQPVQGLSKLRAKVTAVESYGSPISTYNVSVGGVQFVGSDITTQELWFSGQASIQATVKDKRGRSGTASTSINVLAYIAPSISKLSVIRCDEDGVENAQGKFVAVLFSAAITSLNGKNTAQYTLRFKAPTSETYTEIALTDLTGVYTVTDYRYIFEADNNNTYDVQIVAADNHGSATRSTSASTAFAFMDWHKSGTGLAFGKLSEKEYTLEVALAAEFSQPIVQMGNAYSAFIPEGGQNAGSTGYDLMARITIAGTYANAPLTFVFTRRGAMLPMTVHFSFVDGNTLDPALGFRTIEGENYGAYLVKSGTSTWDLYVARGGAYDFITLQSWHMAQYMASRVNVTFPGTFASSLPAGATQIMPTFPRILLDLIYPVGTVLVRYDLQDPGLIFGGTWSQITARVLRAVGTGGTIGGEGTIATGSGRTYVDVAVWRRTA